jgi:hypothetical protein
MVPPHFRPTHRRSFSWASLIAIIGALLWTTDAFAVRDEDNQERWEKPVGNGPDKDVPGFLVNLGPTGARAILKSKSFVVKYIFKGTPAAGRLKLNDVIVGVNGKEFAPHTFGGRSVGYDGPMMDFGLAIEEAEGYDGTLTVNVKRNGQPMAVQIPLKAIGKFSKTFPINCKKSDLLKQRAYKYLMTHPDSWRGMAHSRSSVGLAMLSSGVPEYEAAGKQMILGWNRAPNFGAWTWPLAYQSMTLAEYYLLTGDKSVLPTIKTISKLLLKNQYKGKIIVWEAHGGADQATIDKHQALYDGGFGHGPYTPGYKKNGYGPMQYTTILAVMAWQMAEKCGVVIDGQGDAIERAFKFIDRGTNQSGYVAYGGEFTLNNGPIDWVRWKAGTSGDNPSYAGRVGCAIFAHKMSPEISDSRAKVKLSISYLKKAYKSIPDGHACAVLGFSWGLLGAAASHDEELMRTMYDYHKAWFNMARCADGSYVVLPGRDYADGSYYRSSRYHLTGVMAMFYGLGNPKLQLQGVQVSIPGVNHKELRGNEAIAYRKIVKKQYGDAAKALTSAPDYQPDASAYKTSVNGRMMTVITAKTTQSIEQLTVLDKAGQWHTLKQQIEVQQKQFGGVPMFDQHVATWATQFADKSGRLIVEADKYAVAGSFGRAMKSLQTLSSAEGAKFSNVAQLLKTNILQSTQQMIAGLEQMQETGRWHSLKQSLEKHRKTFSGIEVFDSKAKAWAELLKTSSGRSMVNAHKLYLAQSHGLSAKALNSVIADAESPAHTAAAKSLMDENVAATNKWIDGLMAMEGRGHWRSLNDRLFKAKNKLAGIGSFDDKYASLNKQFKTPFGAKMIAADKLFGSQSYGAAAIAVQSAISTSDDSEQKAVARRFLEDIDLYALDVLGELDDFEKAGDWYLLKKTLTRWKRKLVGVPSFDEKLPAWEATLKTKPIKLELKIGFQYHRLAALFKMKPTPANRRYVQAFAKKYSSSPYGKMAAKLLG